MKDDYANGCGAVVLGIILVAALVVGARECRQEFSQSQRKKASCAKVCDGKRVEVCDSIQHPIFDKRSLIVVCVDERAKNHFKFEVIDDVE